MLIGILSFSLIFYFNLSPTQSGIESSMAAGICLVQEKMEKEAVKSYTLKSAVITMITSSTAITEGLKSIIYFDDHGKKFTVVFARINPHSAGIELLNLKTIIENDFSYTWDTNLKTGTAYPVEFDKTAQNLDFKNLTPEKLNAIHMRKTGVDTVLGKQCEIYELENNNTKGIFYVWDNIIMKQYSEVAGNKYTMTVISLVENPEIEPGIFQIPEDVKFN